MDSYEKIHCVENQWTIAKIFFDESINEEVIGRTNLKSIGQIAIRVYENEGINYPHFHLENKDKSFDCCVCIYENKYFDHGRHRDQLNTKQRKQLDEFLRTEHNDPTLNVTYWEYIAYMWEKNNKDRPGYRHYKTDKQPDYTKMTDSVRGTWW